ncbi:MAG: hypothetical protein PUP46_05135 [Endozoicomonas sp. (ex Botrylloides leachii)]|nr:hypothetical protein [Endozoicomonas sp. (ex Botrylloides leachii)]
MPHSSRPIDPNAGNRSTVHEVVDSDKKKTQRNIEASRLRRLTQKIVLP